MIGWFLSHPLVGAVSDRDRFQLLLGVADSQRLSRSETALTGFVKSLSETALTGFVGAVSNRDGLQHTTTNDQTQMASQWEYWPVFCTKPALTGLATTYRAMPAKSSSLLSA